MQRFGLLPNSAGQLYAFRRIHSRLLPKSKFSAAEDGKLLDLVARFGTTNWIHIASLMETRNPRQCRERYANYLNPDLRQDNWTADEDLLLTQKHQEFGSKWNKIAKFFVNRSDNALRNRWQLLNRHKVKAGRTSRTILELTDVLAVPKPEPRRPVSTEVFDILDAPEATDESGFLPWWRNDL
jgi:hypothetical protein